MYHYKYVLERVGNLSAQFKNWRDWLDAGDVKIMGTEKKASDFINLIKDFVFLGISGLVVVFVGVTVYGGFLWVTAGDSEETLQKAKKVMKSGVMGVVIAFVFLVLLAIIAGFLGISITGFEYLKDIFGD